MQDQHQNKLLARDCFPPPLLCVLSHFSTISDDN